MAAWHIDQFRGALTTRGWRVVAELEGDGYRFAATWQVQRSTKFGPFHIDFDAMDDLEAMPVEQAYAASVRELRGVSAYFFRKSNTKAWKEQIEGLLNALDQLESA